MISHVFHVGEGVGVDDWIPLLIVVGEPVGSVLAALLPVVIKANICAHMTISAVLIPVSYLERCLLCGGAVNVERVCSLEGGSEAGYSVILISAGQAVVFSPQ